MSAKRHGGNETGFQVMGLYKNMQSPPDVCSIMYIFNTSSIPYGKLGPPYPGNLELRCKNSVADPVLTSVFYKLYVEIFCNNNE